RPGDHLRLLGWVERGPVAGTDQVSGTVVVFDRATGMRTDGVEGHDRAVAELDEHAGVAADRVIECDGSSRRQLARPSDHGTRRGPWSRSCADCAGRGRTLL